MPILFQWTSKGVEDVVLIPLSEVTPQGINTTDLGQTLLNGNNIAMVRSSPCVGSELIRAAGTGWKGAAGLDDTGDIHAHHHHSARLA